MPQQNKIDINLLKSQHNIIDVIGSYVDLRQRGSEHYGICPFHEDHTKSLQVNENKQLFSCFACGVAGDVLDFLTEYKGYKLPDAIKELQGGSALLGDGVQKRAAKASKPRITWTSIKPKTPAKSFTHYLHGEPHYKWTYHDTDGSPIGYICRFNMEDGSKEVMPFTYCKSSDGRAEWRYNGFGLPRPLYNLHKIHATQGKQKNTVLIVEGEKTAEHVEKHIDTAVVTTWIGGAQAVERTDFGPLAGRMVILWPDNDKPGFDAMEDIAHLLTNLGCTIKYIHNTKDKPKHWDAADEEWGSGEMRKYIRQNMHDHPPEWDEPVDKVDVYDFIEEDDQPIPTTIIPPDEPEEDESISPKGMFRILGFVKGDGENDLAFYSVRFRSVLVASPGGLSKNFMLQLAPAHFWEDNFPASKGGWDSTAACNWIIETAGRRGLFSTKWVRGRGAWYDDGHVVVHAGDQLIVDGVPTPLGQFRSKYIYEIGDSLNFYTLNPLTKNQASKILNILERFSWSREVDAYLLAGWCVVAPICGGMHWRPHIWITGPAGSGKTWIMSNFVSKILGDCALRVQNETTEAGIRQTLKYDALPVVFDEAEGENATAQQRMQGVLTLMRSSSSEDGGTQIKGSASGGSVSYRIRSCFAFSSIGIVISQQSDRSRVTLLSLQENKDADRRAKWEETQMMYYKLVTDDYIRSFQARTIKLLPVIIKNAKTFSKAIDMVLESKRIGDQLGALLAGAFSLKSDGEISIEAAVEWVKSKNWDEERQLQNTKDEMRLLDHIVQHVCRVETKEGGPVTRSIGEVIHGAIREGSDPVLSKSSCENALKRMGIKIKDGELIFSDNSNELVRILKNTPWTRNYSKIIERIPGANKKAGQRFANGSTVQRATAIPITIINNEYGV